MILPQSQDAERHARQRWELREKARPAHGHKPASQGLDRSSSVKHAGLSPFRQSFLHTPSVCKNGVHHSSAQRYVHFGYQCPPRAPMTVAAPVQAKSQKLTFVRAGDAASLRSKPKRRARLFSRADRQKPDISCWRLAKELNDAQTAEPGPCPRNTDQHQRWPLCHGPSPAAHKSRAVRCPDRSSNPSRTGANPRSLGAGQEAANSGAAAVTTALV